MILNYDHASDIYKIKRIYSTLLVDNNIDTNEIIRSLSLSFNDNNKLILLKTISYDLKIKETSEFLTKENIINKLKDDGIFILVGLIPVIINILQYFFPHPIPNPMGK